MTVKYSDRTGLLVVADKGADVYEQMKSRDRYIDFMLNPQVLRITNDPTDTTAISNGSCFIGNTPTGVFAGKSGYIGIYHGTENGNSVAGWETYAPFEGLEIILSCSTGHGEFNGSPVEATLTWKFTLSSWMPKFGSKIVISGVYDDPTIALTVDPFAVFIVGDNPVSDFTGHSGKLAFRDLNTNEWRFVRVGEGQECYVITESGFTNYLLLNDGSGSIWLDKTKLLFSQYRDFFATRFNRTRASLFNNSSAPYTAWDMFQLPSTDPYFKNLPSYPVRYISLDSNQELRLQEPVTEDSDGISGDLPSNSFYEVHLFIKLNGFTLNTSAHGQVWMTGTPVLDVSGWNYIRAVWVDLPGFTGWRYYQIRQSLGGGSGPTTASELPFVPFDTITAIETQSAIEQTLTKIKKPKIDVAVETVSTASVSGTYNHDVNNGSISRLTLLANSTIGLVAPTTLVSGTAVCVTIFVNPATFTATWAADFDWGTAGAPTLTASKWNRIVASCVYGDAKWQVSAAGLGFAL